MTLYVFVDPTDHLVNAVTNPVAAKDLKKHYHKTLPETPLTLVTFEQGMVIGTETLKPLIPEVS